MPRRRRLLHEFQGTLETLRIGALHRLVTRPRGCIILMYHAVACTAEHRRFIAPHVRMSRERFEAAIRWIAGHRRTIDLSSLAARGCDTDAGTVGVTFDDGYRDVVACAAPLMRDLAVPATVFLATRHLDRGDPMWIDRVFRIVQERTRDAFRAGGEQVDLSTDTSRRHWLATLMPRLLRAGADERRAILAEAEAGAQPRGDAPRLILDWDDVRDARRAYPDLSFGVHTATHCDLSDRPADEIRAELDECVCRYEEELGERPRHFAYPYGRSDANADRVVAEYGFETALVNEGAALNRPGTDPLRLVRVAAPDSLPLLRHYTSGSYPDLSLMLTGRA